jgi:hypothetical protein
MGNNNYCISNNNVKNNNNSHEIITRLIFSECNQYNIGSMQKTAEIFRRLF